MTNHVHPSVAHASLSPLLDASAGDALHAAEELSHAPSDDRARRRAERAFQRLTRAAFAHMRAEENRVFPRAVSHGMSLESLRLLLDDHTSLRELSERIEHAGFHGVNGVGVDEVADWFALFVRLFVAHEKRESEMLSEA